MLALSAMSAGWQTTFYALAVVLFVVAGLLALAKRATEVALLPFGLAAFVFVFLWNAIAAT